VIRINALVREHGLNYSRFINGLKKAGVGLDRKQLAVLAMGRDQLFNELVRVAKSALAGAA
jgi:large subunit ribosomal protein L20